ncbi:MAG: hypothetical protein ACRDHP_17805 [Ktedonobacterales bacterium]
MSDITARTTQRAMRHALLPTEPPPARSPRRNLTDEDGRIDDWLTTVSRCVPTTRLAPPSDFTARVMARLEAGPTVAPVPTVRTQPNASLLERLCVVGGVFGVSFLLVAATLVIMLLLTPATMFTLLNALVAALVAVLLLAGLLFDALNALAANPSLVCLLLALVAGMLALWSHVLHPAVRTPGEA